MDHGRSGALAAAEICPVPPAAGTDAVCGLTVIHAEPPAWVRRVAIATSGVESLNAAVAAGIACFETARRGAAL